MNNKASKQKTKIVLFFVALLLFSLLFSINVSALNKDNWRQYSGFEQSFNNYYKTNHDGTWSFLKNIWDKSFGGILDKLFSKTGNFFKDTSQKVGDFFKEVGTWFGNIPGLGIVFKFIFWIFGIIILIFKSLWLMLVNAGPTFLSIVSYANQSPNVMATITGISVIFALGALGFSDNANKKGTAMSYLVIGLIVIVGVINANKTGIEQENLEKMLTVLFYANALNIIFSLFAIITGFISKRKSKEEKKESKEEKKGILTFIFEDVIWNFLCVGIIYNIILMPIWSVIKELAKNWFNILMFILGIGLAAGAIELGVIGVSIGEAAWDSITYHWYYFWEETIGGVMQGLKTRINQVLNSLCNSLPGWAQTLTGCKGGGTTQSIVSYVVNTQTICGETFEAIEYNCRFKSDAENQATKLGTLTCKDSQITSRFNALRAFVLGCP